MFSRIVLIASIIAATTAHASEVMNTRTGERLIAKCIEQTDMKCSAYEISYKDFRINDEYALTKIHTRNVTDANDLFLLNEKLDRFQIMPVTRFAYAEGYGEVAIDALGTAAGLSLVFAILAQPEAASFLMPIGVVVAAAPSVADIASMPIRALVRGIRVYRAKKDEAAGFRAVQALIDDNTAGVVRVRNHEFKRMMRAFKNINSGQKGACNIAVDAETGRYVVTRDDTALDFTASSVEGAFKKYTRAMKNLCTSYKQKCNPMKQLWETQYLAQHGVCEP